MVKGLIMKLRIFLLCIIMLPSLATAEIYKWKDKDGVVRYSDVPPPSSVQQESMYGKKVPKPTGLKPLAEVEGDATVEMNKIKAATGKEKTGTDNTATKKTDKTLLIFNRKARKDLRKDSQSFITFYPLRTLRKSLRIFTVKLSFVTNITFSTIKTCFYNKNTSY